MQVVRVVTNETCNQNCAFCSARRPREQPDLVRAARSQVSAAAQISPRELVLTGGEPCLRRDLEILIREAKELGAERVVLETNGSLIDQSRAQALASAGLDCARVHLPAWGADADRVTRDPGGFEATLAALHALASVGVTVEIAVPVVRSNVAAIARLPAELAAAGITPSAIVVGVPVDGPDVSALASLTEATAAVAELAAAARLLGIQVRLGQAAPLPPCAFNRPGRVAHLFSLSPGGKSRAGFSRVSGCEQCSVEDRCPGVPSALLTREPALATQLTPIREDRMRRRLSMISSVNEQIARELVTREVSRGLDGRAVPTHTVRVNFNCNQSCHFCFVSTHLPGATHEQILLALTEAGREGAILALSGGEPTLNPRLPEYARLAKQAGVREIELQTNATRLAEPGLLGALIEAGVDLAFVSLHGATAEVCDAVTAAPGTFVKTVAGLDAASAGGLKLRLNFVFCELNHQDFPNVVRLVADRWPSANLSVSFVAPSTDMVPRVRALIPRYSMIMPYLTEGLRIAREHKVQIAGFESMCGMPLCLIPEGMEEYFGLAEIGEGEDGGEFVKPEPCQACDVADRCFGVRRGYAALNGVSELKPVRLQAGRAP